MTDVPHARLEFVDREIHEADALNQACDHPRLPRAPTTIETKDAALNCAVSPYQRYRDSMPYHSHNPKASMWHFTCKLRKGDVVAPASPTSAPPEDSHVW